MNAVIISIGFELLNGRTVNSNATYIAKKLNEIGIKVNRIITIADTGEAISQALREALENSEVVITTGGLGPTNDDITKEVVMEVMGSKPVFEEKILSKIEERFKRRGLVMPEINRNQAIVPDNAKIIYNEPGTAPGLLFINEGRYLAVLPGVPKEMRFLMEKGVLPELRKKVTRSIPQIVSVKTAGLPESALYEKIIPYFKENSGLELMFYPDYSGVEIKVFSDDNKMLDAFINKVKESLGEHVYSINGATGLPEAVAEILIKKRLTVAVAESCTGGLLGHLLTSVPGSSSYFLGGVTAYANDIKQNILGVSEERLISKGAVSVETAKQMAEGVKHLFNSDLALSVTGIAGPEGGTKEKPVGLVYIGIADNKGVKAIKHIFSGDREMNKYRSAYAALNLLRLNI